MILKKPLSVAVVLLAALSTQAQSYQVPSDLLFEPEFHAYQYGRKNDDKGQGQQWYRRFMLFHITDVHGTRGFEANVIRMAQGRADVLVNTGDDSDHVKAEMAESTKENLSISRFTVDTANKDDVPILQVPGNHDMPGITKGDFFSRICSNIVQAYNPSVVWGDEPGKRAYGYCDYDSSPEMGAKFRIIMLDPFDYDDGKFEVRKFMTATFTQKQIDWLINTLKDAAEKGLHVITLMHYSFGDNNLPFSEERAKPDAHFYQDAFMIPDIIDAAQHGTRLRKTYADEQGTDNIKVDADFSKLPHLEYVCHLFGHIHSKNQYRCQKTDGSKMYDILMLGEAALGVNGTIMDKVHRPNGDANLPRFSALSIDAIEKCIYRISYGPYLHYDGSNDKRTVKLSYKFE